MRSAGCVINDIADRKIDRFVQRTKSRPLACGKMNVAQAYALFAILVGLSGLLAIALLQIKTVALCVVGLVMCACYPLFKRFTNYPQVFLGFTFAFGVLVVCVEANQPINLKVIVLYLACVFWVLGYDTIYALADVSDDKKIGVGSLAVRLGARSKHAIYIFYSMFFLLLSIFAQAYARLCFVALLLCCLYIIYRLDGSTASCIRTFKYNTWVGLITCAIMLLDRLYL